MEDRAMPAIAMPGLIELLMILAFLGVPALVAGVMIWVVRRQSGKAKPPMQGKE
jgi:hypothetical protein